MGGAVGATRGDLVRGTRPHAVVLRACSLGSLLALLVFVCEKWSTWDGGMRESQANLGFLDGALLNDSLDDFLFVIGPELVLESGLGGTVECPLRAVSIYSRVSIVVCGRCRWWWSHETASSGAGK